MKIRRLQPGDEELAARAVNTVKPAEERKGNEATADYMSKFLIMDSSYLIAAYNDDTPIGFALGFQLPCIDRDRCMMNLYEIGVLPEYNRQGVGRAMINCLKEICGEKDFTEMWVITNESNSSAMGLYESTGAIRPAKDDVVFVYEFD